jgi:uncharacterized protein (TIGR02452 family)
LDRKIIDDETYFFDLGIYLPEDIAFAKRMREIMRNGRFGETNARKEIYKINTELFKNWKNGTLEMDFGNYDKFLADTKIYREYFNVENDGIFYNKTRTGCANIDCVDLAEVLIAKGYNPAILNLASAKKPGGGYRDGMGAQEESLCRSSNLSLSLYQYGDPKYINVRESGVLIKEIGYPLDINYGGIYTPQVTFFRRNKDQYFTMRENFFKCDVISVAALSFNGRADYSSENEISYQSSSGGFTTEGKEIMLNKIRTIFRWGMWG